MAKKFNPDNLTREQLGPDHRFMRYGELIPDEFDYWWDGFWQHQSVTEGKGRYYLQAKDTCTRRLPKYHPPKYQPKTKFKMMNGKPVVK